MADLTKVIKYMAFLCGFIRTTSWENILDVKYKRFKKVLFGF